MLYDFDTYVERRNTNSAKWDAYDPDILPMWIADSDFRSPVQVREALAAAVERGIFGYPHGTKAYLEACAGWMATRFGWQVSPDQIEWTPSLGTAIGCCIQTFTSPGDNVCMLWPIYPPFIGLCRMNGRTPVGSTLKWKDGKYEIDFDELEKALANPLTTLFLLCSPHNPTGRVFTRSELQKMGELCLKHNVTVFSDEIHGDIVYQERQIPFPTISDEVAQISIVGVNASKTFNLADLRTAAVISDNAVLLHRFGQHQKQLKLGPSSLGMTGAGTAWRDCAGYADQLVQYLRKNIETAVSRINRQCKGIRAYFPEATYLLWLDCSEMGLSQEELVKFFLEKAKVGLNNGADFGPGGMGHMRMNVACPGSLLNEGLERIEKALAKG